MARRPGKVIEAIGTLAGLLVVGWPSAVTAQPAARFALSWSGPPGCPTAENVQARVDALRGGASASSFADVRASGQVERVDNGFRLLLVMGVGDTPSSRIIEARTCDELAGAAAIAIALLARSTMDDASEEASQPATSDAPAASASDPLKESAPPTSSANRDTAASQKNPSAETSSAGLHLVLDAPIGVVGWGSLPSTSLGLGAAVGIRWRALRAMAGGEVWHPQTDRVSGFATRYTLQSGRADVCLIHDMYGLELAPCLGAALQRLTGEGVSSEVFSARSRTATWVSGTGGIFSSLPTPGFTHLRFFGAASVLVSPSRPRFVIEQLGPVHEPALAALRLDLGCEWIF